MSKRAASNVSTTLIILALSLGSNVQSTRINLDYQEEPTSVRVNNHFRSVAYNKLFYHLTAANVSQDGIVTSPKVFGYYPKPDGKFDRFDYKFNSSEMFRSFSIVAWFLAVEEQVALQIYDDSKVQDLASGPQVNQQLCKLHLDYMIHMIKKHLTNVMNSTEESIFTIMNSFDSPRRGLVQANTVFPGDYSGCKSANLNVIKSELSTVDKEAGQKYFSKVKEEAQRDGNRNSWRSMFYFIRSYVGPFFGFHRNRDAQVPTKVYIDKMHLVPTRYCFANLRWPFWSNSTFYKRNLAFRTATCLPETCDSNSLNLFRDKIKFLVDFQMSKYHAGYYIDSLYCLPDEKSPMRNPFKFISTNLFILFNLFWFALIIWATGMHISALRSKKKPKQIKWKSEWQSCLNSWSFIENYNACMKFKHQPSVPTNGNDKNKDNGVKTQTTYKPIEGRVDFSVFDGIKASSSVWIIYVHSSMLLLAEGWNPKIIADLFPRSYLNFGLYMAASVVDLYFVLTGILTSRTLLQYPSKVLKNPIFWLKFFLYRYIRVIPLYLLIHWFLKSTFRFVGSGPFWDYGTSDSSWSSVCQNESYWVVIFPHANFKAPPRHCNPVGWYLANDIQLSLLTPIFVLAYRRSPKLGHIVSFFSCFTLTICHIIYYYFNIKDSVAMLEFTVMWITQVTEDVTGGYVQPQYRCVSYIIGLTAGYIMLSYECGNIRAWPKWFTYYGQLYCYLCLYMIYSITYIASLLPLDNDNFNRWIGALSQGTFRAFIGPGFALLILIVSTTHMSQLRTFFRSRVFTPFANALLSITLVQMPWTYYRSQLRTSQPEISEYHIVSSIFLWTIESSLVGLVVHILYESPLRRFIVKFMIYTFGEPSKRVEESPKQLNGLLNQSEGET